MTFTGKLGYATFAFEGSMNFVRYGEGSTATRAKFCLQDADAPCKRKFVVFLRGYGYVLLKRAHPLSAHLGCFAILVGKLNSHKPPAKYCGCYKRTA